MKLSQIIFALVALYQPFANAQTATQRVEQSMQATTEDRKSAVKSLDDQLAQAQLNLLRLEAELESAEKKAVGPRAARFVKKATLLGAVVSVVAIIHGLNKSSGYLNLPDVTFFYGFAGLGASGLSYMAASAAEVKLTPEQVTELRAQVVLAKKEVELARAALANK